MIKRQVFFSFHYKPDFWRTSIVRNIGAIEGSKLVSDNDWEEITYGGDQAIKQWIDNQLSNKSCTVVLIGSQTANRKWINYEIVKSWNSGIGVVGIHIHGLKNQDGQITLKGNNPFDFIIYGDRGLKLSQIVKCYDPKGIDSKERYDWISKYMPAIIEEAIQIRKKIG